MNPSFLHDLKNALLLRLYLLARGIYRVIPLPADVKVNWTDRVYWRVPALRRLSSHANASSVSEISRPQGDWSIDLAASETIVAPPGQRVLIVEHRLPIADRTSSALRLLGIVKLLRERNWDVTFVSDSPKRDYHWILANPDDDLPQYERILKDLGVKTIFEFENAIDHLRNEGITYALAILSMPEIVLRYSPFVRVHLPRALLANDTVDLHGIRLGREAEIRTEEPGLVDKAAHYVRVERTNIDSSDLTIVVSSREADEVRSYSPNSRTLVIPNIHTTRMSTREFSEREGLLFIGHYLHSPNEDAVLYFVNEIFPAIRHELGSINLTLLGSSMTAQIRKLNSDSVRTVGYVAEPDPWFERSRVFIAPLRFGAGVKGKIGHALSLGLPVVTTGIGAEGMHLTHNHDVLIADTPDDFARAVVRLHHEPDLWRKLSANGCRLIDREFSPQAVATPIDQLLARAAAKFSEQSAHA